MFRIVPQLIVASIGRSVQFYVERLGFAVMLQDPPEDPVFVTLEREDASLFLVAEASVERPDLTTALAENERGVGVRFYIEVDDARVVYDALKPELAGVLSDLKYNEKEDYTEFTLRDPDGYEIGVYS